MAILNNMQMGGFNPSTLTSRMRTQLRTSGYGQPTQENNQATIVNQGNQATIPDGMGAAAGGIIPGIKLPVIDDIYDDVSGNKQAKEALKAQEKSLQSAEKFQREQYQEARGYMEPYATIVTPQDLQNYKENIQLGVYAPGQFIYQDDPLGSGNYTGQMAEYNYSGQQPDVLSQSNIPLTGVQYQGDIPQHSYDGTPQVGNIQSFMSDMEQDPGYQFQLEQGLKAIDRQAAAGGRFGGGVTAQAIADYSQGLASQEYKKMWDRARQEQAIAQGQEGEMQRRAVEEYGLGRGAERDAYDRALTDTEMLNRSIAERRRQREYGYESAVGREAEAQRRAQEAYGRESQAEQEQYTRFQDQQALNRAMEQEKRRRALEQYSLDEGRREAKYSQMQGLIGMGQQGATNLGNVAIGQGATMADLAVQLGNAQAAAAMAQRSPLQMGMEYAPLLFGI
jgi:hypothetical protein